MTHRPWTDEELAELEDPATWSDEDSYVHPGVENPGAVISIRVTARELERIDRAAIALHQKLTDFIRDAALEKADAVASEAKARTAPLRRPA